jgi:alpha-galactosidase
MKLRWFGGKKKIPVSCSLFQHRGIELSILLVAAAVAPVSAQTAHLATSPPMGWNSWDAYGTSVTETEVKANADVMAADLKPYGWKYVVVDIQWYEPNAKAHGYRADAQLAMDANGRLIPAPNRFPSSVQGSGFKALADYVHSKGLLFGIHILRGIPRQAVTQNVGILGTGVHAADIADKQSVCTWNTDMYGVDLSRPGSQAYYDSIVALYAGWGVDFIKADDMARPYHKEEIEALHRAILTSGRPIILSLSPGPAPLDEIQHLRSNAQMWRIEDDLWDNWDSVKKMYFHAESWVSLIRPGAWADADMLPLGHIGIRAERGNDRLSQLSRDEQQTLVTIWSMLRSPLIFGGDLISLDSFTRSLLTNAGVLAVDQESHDNKVAYQRGELRVWTATSDKTGSRYLAVFNLSDQVSKVKLSWDQVGFAKAPKSSVDLWTGNRRLSTSVLELELRPHASVLYRLELN